MNRWSILRNLCLIVGSIMLYRATRNVIFLIFLSIYPNINSTDGTIVTYVIDVNSMWIGSIFLMMGGLLLVYTFLKFRTNKASIYTGLVGSFILVGIFLYQLYFVIGKISIGSYHPLYLREVIGGLLLGSMGLVLILFHFYCHIKK